MQENNKPLFWSKFKGNTGLFIFILIWLIVNLIQAAFSELAHDEAYYWMYSQKLAWGYFDHPPMIAILVKIGYWLFPNEIGVRLITTFMGTATILFTFLLIDKTKRSLITYVFLCFSMVLVQSHVGGFLAIPDVPVIFFTVLFFLTYKYYIGKDSLILAVVLGIIAVAMLLSKYHGFLVLFFTFISNISIVKRKTFWIVPILVIAGTLPHLMWQIEYNFPSIEYHLISRSSPYKFDHTLNFLYSQLLIAGPFISIHVFYLSIRNKVNSTFEKVLKINLIGILVFFFLSSFKGHVEAHWTAVMFIPLLVLSHNAFIGSSRWVKWLRILFYPSIVLMILIRLAIIIDFFPGKIQALKELHNWPKWSEQIDSIAEGRPVIFVNSFQRPSKYSFYTKGKLSTSLNNLMYRKNQFDIWNYEDSLQHKPVLLVSSKTCDDTLKTVIGEDYAYQIIDDFVSYGNIDIVIDLKIDSLKSSSIITFPIEIKNHRNGPIVFPEGSYIVAIFQKHGEFGRPKYLYKLQGKVITTLGNEKIQVEAIMPRIPGKYAMYISIKTSNLSPGFNSIPIDIEVQ